MYRIGVDLGGMTIKAGIVDDKGTIVISKSVPTDSHLGVDNVLDSIVKLTFDLVEEYGISIDEIESIGVGTPGTVDTKKGIVLVNYNLGFENVNITKIISEKTGKPCFVENDANAAGIAEYHVGSGRNFKNIITITIGTGIGGSYISNGECLAGSYFNGGEFGHMVISVNGRPCTCGRNGCFESYCSARELTTEIKRVAKLNTDSILVELVNGEIDELNPKVMFEALEKGCIVAKQVFDEYILYFAEAIANFICVFEPEIVLIGGGLSKQGEKLLAPLRPLVYKRCFGGSDKVKIETTKFLNDAGIIGASFLGK